MNRKSDTSKRAVGPFLAALLGCLVVATMPAVLAADDESEVRDGQCFYALECDADSGETRPSAAPIRCEVQGPLAPLAPTTWEGCMAALSYTEFQCNHMFVLAKTPESLARGRYDRCVQHRPGEEEACAELTLGGRGEWVPQLAALVK